MERPGRDKRRPGRDKLAQQERITLDERSGRDKETWQGQAAATTMDVAMKPASRILFRRPGRDKPLPLLWTFPRPDSSEMVMWRCGMVVALACLCGR